MAIPRLDIAHTALLVIDVQEKLLPHMHNAPAVVGGVGRCIEGAKVLNLPILVTEQYRKGLGVTVQELAGASQATLAWPAGRVGEAGVRGSRQR